MSNGGVKAFVEAMENNQGTLGFIDLCENAIKALDKIALENPHQVLQSGALQVVLQMMDFFEQSTQRRIISIALILARNLNNEPDFTAFFMPVMGKFAELLQMRGEHQVGLLENVSTILLRIVENFLRFFNPASHFDKLTSLTNQLLDRGVIHGVLQALFEASCEGGSAKQFSSQTMLQFLRILTICARFSPQAVGLLVTEGGLKVTEGLVPEGKEGEVKEYPYS